MTRSFMFGLLMLVPGAISAQALSAQQGTIAYSHSVQLDLEIPEEVRARLQARGRNRAGGRGGLPTERVSEVVLLFNSTESLMKPIPPAPRQRGGDGAASAERTRRLGGFADRIRMGSASRSARETIVEAHVRYDEGMIVESREFLGRRFLIEDARPAFEWKLSGEQAEFLGYVVHKATAEQGDDAIEAWFTPQIPVQGGPGPYGGLPGMILVVSVNEGHTQYTATEVSTATVAEGVIVQPTEGEAVTREEYEKIVAEKLDELRRTRGGEVQ